MAAPVYIAKEVTSDFTIIKEEQTFQLMLGFVQTFRYFPKGYTA
jgi:hypothetical protein